MTLGRCLAKTLDRVKGKCRVGHLSINRSVRFRFDVLNFHTTVEWGLLVAYTASLDTICITDTKLPAKQSEANHKVCAAG